MKVKELINLLSLEDGEKEVMIGHSDFHTAIHKVECCDVENYYDEEHDNISIIMLSY